ncbi:hypothetical protein AJ79_00966 [Helicocarpus griseus UAMH5409]|uniref:Uncharacterized protein n=1 Tax=Helicocarpus griseus UAMH5409 TaxID=1447875 RepID=A0A2B7Y8N4_9EURO|nr:hypothetical protein AJ79_00966 [Helicocarpus griseus UAMH5409]
MMVTAYSFLIAAALLQLGAAHGEWRQTHTSKENHTLNDSVPLSTSASKNIPAPGAVTISSGIAALGSPVAQSPSTWRVFVPASSIKFLPSPMTIHGTPEYLEKLSIPENPSMRSFMKTWSGKATSQTTARSIMVTKAISKRYVSRDKVRDIIERQYCPELVEQKALDPMSGAISRTYFQGTPDEVEIAIDWERGHDFEPNVDGCKEILGNRVLDGCDGNDPKNPNNRKGGDFVTVGEVEYRIGPKEEAYAEGACWVHIKEELPRHDGAMNTSKYGTSLILPASKMRMIHDINIQFDTEKGERKWKDEGNYLVVITIGDLKLDYLTTSILGEFPGCEVGVWAGRPFSYGSSTCYWKC